MKFTLIQSYMLMMLFAGLLISCGGEDDTEAIENFLLENNLTAESTSSGLYYDIINPGNGDPITDEDFLSFHLKRYNLDNELDGSSYSINQPIAIHMRDLADGINEGLKLINNGGSIRLYIPPSLTNGGITEGALIYEMDIIGQYDSVIEFNETTIEEYALTNNLTVERTDDGLYYLIEEAGNENMPSSSSNVTVDYKGYLLNGTQFDSSYDRGVPLQISLTSVIQGWTLGIPLFGEGGKGTLLIPSYLAYGEQGSTNIPGNYPIAFDIELISFQ